MTAQLLVAAATLLVVVAVAVWAIPDILAPLPRHERRWSR